MRPRKGQDILRSVGRLLALCFAFWMGGSLLGTASAGQTGEAPLASRPLGGLRSQAAALLIQGGNGGDIKLAARAHLEPDGDLHLWLAFVPVPGERLSADTQADDQVTEQSVELYAYLLGSGGAVLAHLAEQVALGPEPEKALVVGWQSRLPDVGTVPPKAVLRLLLLDPETGLFGLRSLDLDEEIRQNLASGEFSPDLEIRLPSAPHLPWPGMLLAELEGPSRVGEGTGTPSSSDVVASRAAARRNARQRRFGSLRRTYREALSDGLRGLDLDAATGAALAYDLAGTDQTYDLRGRALATEEAGWIARSPESAVPLLALHERLWRIHRSTGRLALAGRQRSHALAVLEALPADTGPATRTALADVLSSFARRTEAGGMYGEARRLLRRALELAPEHQAARKLLARSLERTGHYAAALEQVNALARSDAHDKENRLRQALLLARLEHSLEARRGLERLVREAAPDWVSILAYEELARLESQERPQRALELLYQAHQRFPNSQTTRARLAWELERANRTSDARSVLAVARAPESRSPRARYAHPSDDVARSLDNAVARHVRLRLPTLQRVLGDR